MKKISNVDSSIANDCHWLDTIVSTTCCQLQIPIKHCCVKNLIRLFLERIRCKAISEVFPVTPGLTSHGTWSYFLLS